MKSHLTLLICAKMCSLFLNLWLSCNTESKTLRSVPGSRQGQRLCLANHSRLILSRGFHPDWSPQPKKDKRNALLTQTHIITLTKAFGGTAAVYKAAYNLHFYCHIYNLLLPFDILVIASKVVFKNLDKDRSSQLLAAGPRSTMCAQQAEGGQQVQRIWVEQAIRPGWESSGIQVLREKHSEINENENKVFHRELEMQNPNLETKHSH